MGDSEPPAAAADFSVRCVRTPWTDVVPGRGEDRGSGTLPAFSDRVHLGSDLLLGQSTGHVPDSTAGDSRIALWRVCVGDDELRGGATFCHPSLAAEDGPSFHHYRADFAHDPGRIADCNGGEPLGAAEIRESATGQAPGRTLASYRPSWPKVTSDS